MFSFQSLLKSNNRKIEKWIYAVYFRTRLSTPATVLGWDQRSSKLFDRFFCEFRGYFTDRWWRESFVITSSWHRSYDLCEKLIFFTKIYSEFRFVFASKLYFGLDTIWIFLSVPVCRLLIPTKSFIPLITLNKLRKIINFIAIRRIF